MSSPSLMQPPHARFRRNCLVLASAVCVTLSLPLFLAGCNRASAGTTVAVASPQAIESAREQMDLIPPPSKTRYMAVHSLESWENPYLTVQENMATLHVTLADANPSQLGAGGMLRPVGARRQDLTIRVSDLPAALGCGSRELLALRPRCGDRRGARRACVRSADHPAQRRGDDQDTRRSRRGRLRVERRRRLALGCGTILRARHIPIQPRAS